MNSGPLPGSPGDLFQRQESMRPFRDASPAYDPSRGIHQATPSPSNDGINAPLPPPLSSPSLSGLLNAGSQAMEVAVAKNGENNEDVDECADADESIIFVSARFVNFLVCEEFLDIGHIGSQIFL
jgi:hypothetical protein